MIFAYENDVNIIKIKNPFLNFGIANVPQSKIVKLIMPFQIIGGLQLQNKVKIPIGHRFYL